MSENTNGLWNEVKDPVTGESSLKEHKPKVVWKSCKNGEHKFAITSNRELQCQVESCGVIQEFVPGRDNEYLKSIGVM